MTFFSQLRNFLKGLFRSGEGPQGHVDRSLAQTANDMRYVNRNIEDNRLDAQSAKNYSASFKKK